MKNSYILCGLLFPSLLCADVHHEQMLKKITQELVQMSPLVQACTLLVKNDMPVKKSNCIRIIQDFDYLLDELCRLQDELLQEKK